MARRVLNKLTAREVATLKAPGRFSDGGGLYLALDTDGRRRWLFLYASGTTRAGKPARREMGLGSARDIPLALARQMAAEARVELAAGRDPMARKREKVRLAKAEHLRFGPLSEKFVDEKIAPKLRSEKHLDQWRTTLGIVPYSAAKVRIDAAAHGQHVAALERLRARPIADVTVDDVVAVLSPIWSVARETASRLRGRIAMVLDFAAAQGLRSPENPAAWRGRLEHILPGAMTIERKNHAAIPYQAMPQLFEALKERRDASGLLLRFIALTACRSGEARGATWAEFSDLDKPELALWSMAADRTKQGKAHRVPLSPAALEILRYAAELSPDRSPDEFVFPSRNGGLTDMAAAMALRRLPWRGEGAAPWAGTTVHGFRSAFRDWAGDQSSFPREIAEAALGHAVGDVVERAYRRGDALERRRQLMAAWGEFCTGKFDE